MTWFENKLWVGGAFVLDGGSAPPNLALWDGETWQAPPGGPVQVPSTVFEIAHDGPGLMIGGFFENIGGIAAQSAARFAGGTWQAYDLPDSTVMAFARDGSDTLYAGGLMSVEGSAVNGGVARWTGTSWGSMDGGLANLTFRGVVSDLAVLDGELVVAGCFDWAGGAAEAPGTIEVPGMARWTGTAWEALDDGSGSSPVSAWFSSLKCGDEGPSAVWESARQRMLVDGSRLYLAGSSAGEGGVASQSIIAYENGQWIAQGEAGRGWSGTARALAVGGPACSVYALGATHVGGVDIGQGVVKDESDAWVKVAGPVPEGRACYSIAADAAGTAYIGCEYLKSEADPYYTGLVYRSVGDAWEPVGDEYEGGIAALGVDPAGHLWVVGGGEKGFVAREVGGTFTTPTFDARVSAIAFAPTAEGDPGAPPGRSSPRSRKLRRRRAQFDGTRGMRSAMCARVLPGGPTARLRDLLAPATATRRAGAVALGRQRLGGRGGARARTGRRRLPDPLARGARQVRGRRRLRLAGVRRAQPVPLERRDEGVVDPRGRRAGDQRRCGGAGR